MTDLQHPRLCAEYQQLRTHAGTAYFTRLLQQADPVPEHVHAGWLCFVVQRSRTPLVPLFKAER